MKTVFLLHGGRLKNKDIRNDQYFERLTRDLRDGDEVLQVSFSRDEQAERDETYEMEKGFILAQAPAAIEVVQANEKEFVQQLKQAKAVHFTGGSSALLKKTVQKYPDFINLLAGKVVGGSSAGACLFSTYYYSGSAGLIEEGLGTFPIRVFVHYGNPEFNGTDQSLNKLKAIHEELELVVLKEAEWVEKEKDL